MSTLRANTLKPITSGNSLVLQGDSGGSGVSGPSIDSNGDVDFSQNTNAKVKLPSGGGIYESDGSTEILTESSGAVTLKNTTLENTVVGGAMASGSVSQTGGTSGDPGTGTPTGDIVEEGHTSRGTYVKFANGTMICTNFMSASIDFTSTYGVLYRGSDSNASSHPATFATVTGAGIIVTSSSGGRAFPSNVAITTSQITQINYLHPNSQASLGVTSQLVIYGTWY